jgi:hypothetical protein
MSRSGFENLFAPEKLSKISVRLSKFSYRQHNSITIHEFVNEKAQKDFFEIFGILVSRGTRIPSLLLSLRTPSQHRSVMMGQRKSGGYMHIPPSGMVRNSGSDLDQPLNQPVDGPLHFFAPEAGLLPSCGQAMRIVILSAAKNLDSSLRFAPFRMTALIILSCDYLPPFFSAAFFSSISIKTGSTLCPRLLAFFRSGTAWAYFSWFSYTMPR